MCEISPVRLIGSVTKSRVYFCHARWKGRRRRCIKCNYRMVYYFKINDMDVNIESTNLMILLSTYIGEFNYSPDIIYLILFIFLH